MFLTYTIFFFLYYEVLYEDEKGKEKQKAVEEMTEALILYFAILGENAAAIKAENMETFIKISSYKSGETPGLSSRTKFKYMDLVGK